jgi:colanic acid/amylovoran biosynthesis glycosyltransferase
MLWHRPDVLHVQWIKGIEKFIWVKKFDIKLASSLRGSHIYLTPLIEKEVANSYRKSFPQLDGIHSVCQDLINTAKDYSLPTDRATVIYSGLEIADFPFIKPSEKQSINKDCLNIISVGRASWMKGFDVALDAMHILKTRGVSFKYTIVGAKNAEELTFQVHDLNLQNEVELLDWQPFDRVKKYIQLADVLLISSVSEGIANAAIEAMALGTIVLSTDCGGMKELVKDGINGMMTPMRNPIEIAKTIKLFNELTIQDKDGLAKSARKKVESEFDMDENIGAFKNFYENCLKEW